MAGMTDVVEAAILDYLLATYIATPYLGLSTTTPTDAGANFTEPVGNGYTRLSVPNGQWAAAVQGQPSTKANSTLFTFPIASGGWGLITYVGIFDAAAAGNLRLFGALAASKTVASGDTAGLPVGTVILQLGDPVDVY